MKVKTININQTSGSPSRKSKCWTSYHKCMNNEKLNKAMTVVFCLSILGLFAGMIALTLSRTNRVDARSIDVDTFSETIPKDHMDFENEFCSTATGCTVECKDITDKDLNDAITSLHLREYGCTEIQLKLKRCEFPGNYIQNNWLSELNLNILYLEIRDSNLSFILSGAFNSPVFKQLTSLEIDNSLSDRSLSFKFSDYMSLNGLDALNRLAIVNTYKLELLDPRFFQPVAKTLTNLLIYGIEIPFSLAILLASVKLEKISTVNLKGNHIKTLDSNCFTGIAENVEYLYLMNSKIQTISANTFKNFAKLQTLALYDNELQNLPIGLFENLVKIPKIEILLARNQWLCDCDLLHMQDMILADTSKVFKGNISCANPDEQKNKLIIEVELCLDPDGTTIPSTSQSETIEGCTKDENSDCSSTEESKTTTTVTTNTVTSSTEDATPSQSATESSNFEPTTDSITESSIQPTTDTTNEITTETTNEITTETTSEITTDTTNEITTEQITDTTTEQTTKETTQVTTATPEPSESSTSQFDTQKTTFDCGQSTDDCPVTPPTASPSTSSTETSQTATSTHPSSPITEKTTTIELETTTLAKPFYLNVDCYQGTIQTKSTNESETIEINNRRSPRLFPPGYNEILYLMAPQVSFKFEKGEESEIEIVFDSNYINYDIFLLYYPGFLELGQMSSVTVHDLVHCQVVVSNKILVRQLTPSTVYTFCALLRNQPIISPFQCKSYQTKTPFKNQTWIYQEHRVIILTSFLLLLFLALFIGVIMTYLLIRRIPTLMRGSKRVVMVNNRTTDVMVMPSGSRNNSWRTETSTQIKAEPPTYLTPLPRKSFENKPPLMRSNSDTSLRSARSYVTVSRAPPRFSQVFQPSDFKHELPRRCGSFPHCQPTAPCYSLDPIPPPLPRRSIASTASTVEVGKRSNNSIYRRQPSRIEDETENHYNFII